jgi:hypothetical protein
MAVTLKRDEDGKFLPLIEPLSKDEVTYLYVEKGLTVREIAKSCGYRTPIMVEIWLKKYGIKRNNGRQWSKQSRERLSRNWIGNERLMGIQKMVETKKKLYHMGKIQPWNKGKPFMKGGKNPMWKGGVSFEPYGLEFNEELKEQIRKRDNYTCQECGISQEELGYKLHVHHIDFNKQNNNAMNLVSLCRGCHSLITAKHIVIERFIEHGYN